MARSMRSMTMGAIIGAAAGMLVVPHLDRSTRRRIRKTGRVILNTAGDVYDMMKDMNR